MEKTNLKYRKDSRTKSQFIQDIKNSTLTEQTLIKLYMEDLNDRKGGGYSYIDNGCDNTGEFLKDKKVTTAADFIIIKNNTTHKAEIKFSRPRITAFHIKVHQLKSYIKQDCCIIMFNAVETDDIAYTVMLPKNFQHYIDHGKKKKFWGKECIQFKISDFEWHSV